MCIVNAWAFWSTLKTPWTPLQKAWHSNKWALKSVYNSLVNRAQETLIVLQTFHQQRLRLKQIDVDKKMIIYPLGFKNLCSFPTCVWWQDIIPGVMSRTCKMTDAVPETKVTTWVATGVYKLAISSEIVPYVMRVLVSSMLLRSCL